MKITQGRRTMNESIRKGNRKERKGRKMRPVMATEGVKQSEG